MKSKKIFKILILSLTISVAGCEFPPPEQSGQLRAPEKNSPPFDATVSIDLSKKRPVNRNILGNNVQWIDRGDELLQRGSLKLSPDMVGKARKLGVSVLRYPGGSLSDLYHWKDGMGPMKKRGRNLRSHAKNDDQILMGTAEFLTLVKSLNAEPLITVNVASGTAREAAEWVQLTNITRVKDAQGKLLPKVKYWEIGNEPYLIEDMHKELAVAPEVFANRVNAFIKEMKKVDPSIIVGIPLRNDKLGETPSTPMSMQGFNDKVLSIVKQPFEYVTLHNAYFPLIYDNVRNINTIYLSTMSATRFVNEDIDHALSHLKRYYPKKKFGIAITEYNALFTIGKGDTDGLISSLLGALYVADVLTLFAQREEVWMANYWSLTGNWHFGVIRQDGRTRPSYHVLQAFNRILKGQLISTQINTPTFKNEKAGFIPAADGIPCISSIVTENDGKLSVFIINKHINKKARIGFDFKLPAKVKSIKFQTMTADNFSPDDVSLNGWGSFQSVPTGQSVVMDPHSLAIIEMDMGR
jgi:alpha-L-arabinofuranosidase